MTKQVFVTGANRGLGLEFVTQLAAKNYQIYACCRSPEKADELQALAEKNKQITIKALDVNDTKRVQTLANELSGVAIDILLNNSGVYLDKGTGLGSLRQESFLQTFTTNSIAPLMIAQAFLQHVKRSSTKTLANITSKMGSMDDNRSGGAYAYRASKAALNAVMKSFAVDVHGDNIKVLLLHPGWVRTRMGGEGGLIDPSTSVSGMLKIIENSTLEDSGKFYAYDGKEIAW